MASKISEYNLEYEQPNMNARSINSLVSHLLCFGHDRQLGWTLWLRTSATRTCIACEKCMPDPGIRRCNRCKRRRRFDDTGPCASPPDSSCSLNHNRRTGKTPSRPRIILENRLLNLHKYHSCLYIYNAVQMKRE